MEKIREQTVPGLGVSEWWDIGGGYTALVKTHEGKSAIHVMVNAEHPLVQKKHGQPEHWKKTQSVDVTEKVAAMTLILMQGLAELVSSGTSLTNDQTLRQHIECSEKNVNLVLKKLENALPSSLA